MSSSITYRQAFRFDCKLYRLLQDGVHADVIHWDDDGRTVVITSRVEFLAKVAPLVLSKSCKWDAFQRQLNKYGFKSFKARRRVGVVEKFQRHGFRRDVMILFDDAKLII